MLNKFYNTLDFALLKPGVGSCAGSYANLKCENNPTTNFTVFYFETIYGIKSNTSSPCEYR